MGRQNFRAKSLLYQRHMKNLLHRNLKRMQKVKASTAAPSEHRRWARWQSFRVRGKRSAGRWREGKGALNHTAKPRSLPQSSREGTRHPQDGSQLGYWEEREHTWWFFWWTCWSLITAAVVSLLPSICDGSTALRRRCPWAQAAKRGKRSKSSQRDCKEMRLQVVSKLNAMPVWWKTRPTRWITSAAEFDFE